MTSRLPARSRAWLLVLLAALLVTAAAGAALRATPVQADETASADETIPGDMVHFTLDGKRLVLSDYVAVPGAKLPPVPKLHGAVVLVFGAHWCVPCKDVVKALAAQRDALGAAGAHVIYVHVDDRDRSDGLSNDDIRDKAKAMAEGADYAGIQIVLGGDLQEVRTWYGGGDNVALPAVVFVGKDGSVLGRSGTDGFEGALARFLEAI